jgi:hypothetical protein
VLVRKDLRTDDDKPNNKVGKRQYYIFNANVDSGFKLIEVRVEKDPKTGKSSHEAIVATHNTGEQQIDITKINLKNEKHYKYDSHVLKDGENLMVES